MKPNFICADCGGTLEWQERSCPACGKPVEWPGVPDRRRKERRGSGGGRDEQSGPARRGSSGKMIAGLIIGVVAAAVIFELVSTSGTPSVSPRTTAQAPAAGMSANMAALPQIEALEQQVNQDPRNDRLRLQLANVLQDNRFFDKAIVHYRAYLENHPGDGDARVDLGICYNDIGNFAEAERQMKEAVEKNPRHALGHLNLGIINLQAGNVVEANAWFRKTVAIAPNSTAGQRAQQLLTQHANMSNPPSN